MDILNIVWSLQSYSESQISNKLDLEFAEAVTEAVRLLVEQGDRIVDLENKLATVNGGWIPVSLGFTPEPFVSVLGYMTDAGFYPPVRECFLLDNGEYYFPALSDCHPVSHWMPMPEPPKEVQK